MLEQKYHGKAMVRKKKNLQIFPVKLPGQDAANFVVEVKCKCRKRVGRPVVSGPRLPLSKKEESIGKKISSSVRIFLLNENEEPRSIYRGLSKNGKTYLRRNDGMPSKSVAEVESSLVTSCESCSTNRARDSPRSGIRSTRGFTVSYLFRSRLRWLDRISSRQTES